MKVVIAGSRTLDDRESRFMSFLDALITRFENDYGAITEVVSGMARGPDRTGEQWAIQNGVKVSRFPADWKNNGKAAGPIRNVQMGEYADGGIIMWDGRSNGAKHMAECLRKQNKPFILDIIEPTVYYDHNPNGKITIGFHNPKDYK